MRTVPTTPWLLLALALGTASCASKATLQTDTSSAAIRSARELGAADVPQAALHLQLATESLETANVLFDHGDEEEATSMLLRAEADAELAIALSQAEADRATAQEAADRVRSLQLVNPYSQGSAK